MSLLAPAASPNPVSTPTSAPSAACIVSPIENTLRGSFVFTVIVVAFVVANTDVSQSSATVVPKIGVPSVLAAIHHWVMREK